MNLSDLVEFCEAGRAVEERARKQKAAMVWIYGKPPKAQAKSTMFALHSGGVAIIPTAPVNANWQDDVSMQDVAMSVMKGAAAPAQVVVKCRVSLRVRDNDDARVRVVNWLLDQDRLPLGNALRKFFDEHLMRFRDQSTESLAMRLAAGSGASELSSSCKRELEQMGFEVQVVSVALDKQPTFYSHESLDLADEDTGFTVRLSGGLNTVRAYWVARLITGSSTEARAARAAYHGQLVGRAPKPYLDGLPNQVQPLEAWLPQLISVAMQSVTEQEFYGRDEGWINAKVVPAVNVSLVHGTGWQIESLRVIAPDTSRDSQLFSFRDEYEITGAPGRSIWMEHRVEYGRVDESRWRAAGSPDAQKELTRLVSEEVRRYLQHMRYADVVTDFFGQDDTASGQSAGEATIQERLNNELKPRALKFGYGVQAIICTLDIPDAAYLQASRRIQLPERVYGLMDPGLEVSLSADVEVFVPRNRESLGRFARAQDEDHKGDGAGGPRASLESRIAAIVAQELVSALRKCRAEDYYNSEFVLPPGTDSGAEAYAGAMDNAGRGRVVNAGSEGGLEARLNAAIGEELSARFGLSVRRIDLHIKRDAIIQRMNDLRSRTVSINGVTQFDGRDCHLRGRAVIQDFSRQYWGAFYPNAQRHETVEKHEEVIVQQLTDAAAYIRNAFADGEQRLRELVNSRQLHDAVETAIEREQGIKLRITMLYLEFAGDSDPGFYSKQRELYNDAILKLQAAITDAIVRGDQFGFDIDRAEDQIRKLEHKREELKDKEKQEREKGNVINLLSAEDMGRLQSPTRPALPARDERGG